MKIDYRMIELTKNNYLKIFLICLLVVTPKLLFAHGGEAVITLLSSIVFFLFSGLIVGIAEITLFKMYYDLNCKPKEIIQYNYLIISVTYIIFLLIVFNFQNVYNIPLDSGDFVEAMDKKDRIASLITAISVIFYIGAVIGIKYLVYTKEAYLDTNKGNYIALIAIPNVVLLGIYFFLIFNDLVWFFT